MSTVANFTGNRGEWSEPYVLLFLLTSQEIKICNSDLNFVGQTYEINSILVDGSNVNEEISYKFESGKIIAESSLTLNKNYIELSEVKKYTDKLLNSIINSTTNTFSCSFLDDLWNKLLDPSIKSTNVRKEDIVLEIKDPKNGNNRRYGFSIKSKLGSATSLLNASKMTNFEFNLVSPIVLAKTTPKKFCAQVKLMPMTFVGATSSTYKENLLKINKDLELIIMHSLLQYYGSTGVNSVNEILSILKLNNPLGYSDVSIYKKIFGEFLEATAFGMVPNSPWNGNFSADGGMLIVKENGAIGTFFSSDQTSVNELRKYLIDHAFFDTASTTRHEFGYLIDKQKFRLNLLIRI